MDGRKTRSDIRKQFIIDFADTFSERDFLSICNVYQPILSKHLTDYNAQRDLVTRLVAVYTRDSEWQYLFALYSLSSLQWDILVYCINGEVDVAEIEDSLVRNAFDRYSDIFLQAEN